MGSNPAGRASQIKGLQQCGPSHSAAGAAIVPSAGTSFDGTVHHWRAWVRAPRLPVAGNGYVLPPLPGGIALFGATSQIEDADPRLRAEDQRHNLMQLMRLTGSAPEVADGVLTGRVGWRCVAPDRLPLIGGVADVAAMQHSTRFDQPRFIPRLPGLFVFTALASRGITSAALGARTLASLISGAPCPLEASLQDAVDPARFVSRSLRRARGPGA